ncbi:MAG: PKD domain-containing protein [Chloroflexota bacterium]
MLPKPFASFNYTPHYPHPHQPVTLDAAWTRPAHDASLPIVEYQWTLGDGTQACGQIVEHAYPRQGDYIVTLTVKDQAGNQDSQTQVISVSLRNPDEFGLPVMGWNSYNFFGNYIEKPSEGKSAEEMIRETVDILAAYDMREYGYRYVNLDYAWAADRRDQDGCLVPNPEKFPSGMSALASYIHSKGFKAGIYLTCGLDHYTWDHKQGSLGYEGIDALTIARWGFDFLKYDYCTYPQWDTLNYRTQKQRDVPAEIVTMGEALKATGRNIYYSLCEHGRSHPWTYAAPYAKMWRIAADIRDGMITDAEGMQFTFQAAIDSERYRISAPYQRPGAVNDPDFLVVGLHGRGSGGLTKNSCTCVQYRANFSLWCLASAPLLMGNDFRCMDDFCLETLRNREMIAINQDALVKAALRIHDDGDTNVFVKPLIDGYAVGLYNRSSETRQIGFKWRDLGLADETELYLRDLWKHQNLGIHRDSYSQQVAPNDCVVIRLKEIVFA